MAEEERPAKRTRLLSDDEASSEDEGEGVLLPHVAEGLKINEEYAKRFEHNKKREDKHRLEEVYGKARRPNGVDGENRDDFGGEDESSTDESEDDEADLVDADVDREISDTLQALRSKDPRIYDKDFHFYKEFEAEAAGGQVGAKKEKPMYLQDYHRENLMAGQNGDVDAEEAAVPPQTFQQEQDALRRDLVGKMHASVAHEDDEAEDEDDFLVAKPKQKHNSLPSATVAPRKKITEEDIALADKDPETFLSNFMAAQGWRTAEGSRFQAFDSDDSEDERRAEVFEEAYNLRFEDPETANETLRSYGRDVGKYGVRREDKTGRQKAREREKERKEAEKREREEDKARLRRLKIEEAEEKLKRIKDAAGLRGKDVDLSQWRDILEGDFNDDEWDQEMQRRFGDNYYEDRDADGVDSDAETADAASTRAKLKKPKWTDDIDIKDLVPEFENEDVKPQFSISDDEDGGYDDELEGGAPLPVGGDADEETAGDVPKKKRKTKKDRQQDKAEAKRAARKERLAIEEMIDSALPLSAGATREKKGPAVGFRYRATSPTSFGLSARDILFAEDSQLNEYAGLKKLHAFRDAEKKRRDRKKMSKKARLRQWRKETFGREDEPAGGFERVLERALGGHGNGEALERKRKADDGEGAGNVVEGERRKKRRRAKKLAASDEVKVRA
ncbi:hypothetical protein BAUCODRAFT_21083 [Baudoinia panamericana UAMH 10762]|uniref:Kri1-like C-terminal domain-containing protein n=1 Tax=Baudoinia panamericana (strain UAMH 10762) TaxID=717646 RepID=M2NNP3_BAUPA|nr:uncharacterized protein BAUCODRAFT_21083 [Baudoinia panamericana UAMH 10762]EMD01140.1 hypothetical protein BAUCODRAFT_21083 [Baudoinia panamericana UAMH 10762]